MKDILIAQRIIIGQVIIFIVYDLNPKVSTLVYKIISIYFDDCHVIDTIFNVGRWKPKRLVHILLWS